MNRLLLGAFLLVLLTLPGAAADLDVIEARIEAFHDLRFTPQDFATECEDDSRYEVVDGGRAFRFFEADEASSVGPLGSQPGYLATGCGTVTKHLPVAPDLDRIVVRFEANRVVELYDPTLQAGADLHQGLQVLDAQGNPVHEHHIFPADAPSQPMRAVQFATDERAYGEALSVRWTFRDEGLALQGSQDNPLSGQAFSSMVQDAVVQMSHLVPTDGYTVSATESRDGTLLTTEHRVRVELPAFDADETPALSVLVTPGNEFYGVVAPDGTLIRDVATHDGTDVVGYDQTQSTLQLTPSYTQVTFPRSLVAEHGPGAYTFLFRESDGIQVSPALVPLAGILLIAPIPFAALAWLESRAFRKEAFGRYAASARNLQWGVAMVFVYYAVVVLSAAAGGRIDLMAVWPLPLEGWLLHAQVLVAGIAFTGLWLVARELFLIVRPPRAD